MTNKTDSATVDPDPAAVFATALSLWHAYQRKVTDEDLNLSEAFNGMDNFMRELMRVANIFETWARAHIDFTRFDEVWPYLLEDRFGESCLAFLFPAGLPSFDETDCLRIALRLRLPIKLNDSLRLPIDVMELNPVVGSGFRAFRIQSVRDSTEGGYSHPLTLDDDPFDEEFGTPYFSLYGVRADGLLDHIADRRTYVEAVRLFENLAPGIQFPKEPCYPDRRPTASNPMTSAGPTD